MKKIMTLTLLLLVSLCLQAFSVSKALLPEPNLHIQPLSDHSHEGHSHDVVEEDDSHDFSTHRHSHNPIDHSHDISGILIPKAFMLGMALPHTVSSHVSSWVTRAITSLERPPKAA